MRRSVEPQDETNWIRQAQAGDRAAFARLVERYWSRIFRWLYGLAGCGHRAEDLTQEVFCKAWEALGTYEADHFRGWLFRIARNALIDHRRRQRPAASGALLDEFAAAAPGPLDQLVAQENEVLLRQACRRLPEPFREAFLLWAQEEMHYADMAQVLDITEETARWRVFKARRWLVRCLGSQLDSKTP
ncbi:MAG: sigma-70 family RNA polymerase sigma factor [Gemmataceae bacterium]|nr:sigma-70 family RNA polymerase sigma factor [Gemmataceae bacterium]